MLGYRVNKLWIQEHLIDCSSGKTKWRMFPSYFTQLFAYLFLPFDHLLFLDINDSFYFIMTWFIEFFIASNVGTHFIRTMAMVLFPTPPQLHPLNWKNGFQNI